MLFFNATLFGLGTYNTSRIIRGVHDLQRRFNQCLQNVGFFGPHHTTHELMLSFFITRTKLVMKKESMSSWVVWWGLKNPTFWRHWLQSQPYDWVTWSEKGVVCIIYVMTSHEVTFSSAMRNRTIVFVLISLFVWGVITYFLFLDRPIGKEQDQNKFYNQFYKLEREVKHQIAINRELLRHVGEQSLLKKPATEEPLNVKDTRKDPIKNYVEKAGERNEESKQDQLKLSPSKKTEKKTLPDGSPIIAVLVFSCNRITVQRCLDQLIKLRPNADQFPIIVSQDCEHQQTADIIRSYKDQLLHIQQPDQSDIDIPVREKKFKGYFKIARHYGWALNQVFVEFGYETTIIVEDDLDIAPDFFEYFLGTYPLLVSDKSLWCVSAWNDNGKSGLVDEHASHLLYRTDFFPGLGWMLTRDLWLELLPKWPRAYWDDWIRQPEQRKNRACIRPELSRTRTFGKIGVSNGLFFEKHLKFIKLNEEFVPFTKMNLTYLLKDNYDIAFVNEVYQSKVVSYSELKSGNIVEPGPVRIPYYTRQTYKSTAKMLGLMDDFRSGVPRTGYRGVVTFFYNKRRVHLAPGSNWNGYDITWS